MNYAPTTSGDDLSGRQRYSGMANSGGVVGRALLAKQRWDEAREVFVAPTFLKAEVTSVLRNHVFRGVVTPEDGEIAFAGFQDLNITFHELGDLIDEAWQAAQRVNAPRAYDMLYFALAERLSCDLWTVDRRLVNLLRPHSGLPHWVGEINM